MLKPRDGIWRPDAARIARGPRRAPVKSELDLGYHARRLWPVFLTGSEAYSAIKRSANNTNIKARLGLGQALQIRKMIEG